MPLPLYEFRKQEEQYNLPEISVEECQDLQISDNLTDGIGVGADRKVSETKSEGQFRKNSAKGGGYPLQKTTMDKRGPHPRFTKRSKNIE